MPCPVSPDAIFTQLRSTGGFGGETDIWRDTAARYLGYANEVGEAFRHQVPRGVLPSYALALAYVACDAADKYARAIDANARIASFARAKSGADAIAPSPTVSPAMATIDCFVWQVLASVAIPGATINTAVRVARAACERQTRLPPLAARWIPTVIGLATVPFIVQPIDALVDRGMNLARPSFGMPVSKH